MRVSVVYALPGRQVLRELDLAPGATLADALVQSGLAAEFPEIDDPRTPVGVFGHKMPRHTGLQPGDRVEIYRPLRADPGTARRQRLSRG